VKFASLVFAAISVLWGSSFAREDSKSDKVEKLNPFVVEGSPLGFIGVKHVTLAVGLLGMVSPSGRIKSLVVDEVIAGSPADQAGLKPKDNVLKIDGACITDLSIRELRKYADREIGEHLTMEVRGSGEASPRTLQIVAGRKPKSPVISPPTPPAPP